MNLDACHFNLLETESKKDEATLSPAQLDFQRNMRANLMDVEDKTTGILALRHKPPPPHPGFQSGLRVLYTHQAVRGKLKKTSRHIPQTPDRILDAPELRADFYLNLIDWSVRNVIAVALSEVVHHYHQMLFLLVFTRLFICGTRPTAVFASCARQKIQKTT